MADPFDEDLARLNAQLADVDGVPQAGRRGAGIGSDTAADRVPREPAAVLDQIPFANALAGGVVAMSALPRLAHTMVKEGINTADRWLSSTHQLPGAKPQDDLVLPVEQRGTENYSLNPNRIEQHDVLAPLGAFPMGSPASLSALGRETLRGGARVGRPSSARLESGPATRPVEGGGGRSYGGPRDPRARVSLSRNQFANDGIGLFRYGIYKDGKLIGEATGEVVDGTAYIGWIGSESKGAANNIGVPGVRALREAFREDFPSVINFEGERTSGARVRSDGTPVKQSIDILSDAGKRSSLPGMIQGAVENVQGNVERAARPEIVTPAKRPLVTAVSIDGQVFAKGPTHGFAMDEWGNARRAAGDKSIKDIDGLIQSGRLVEGYVTPEGKFLNRHEAEQYVGVPRSEHGLEASNLAELYRSEGLPSGAARDAVSRPQSSAVENASRSEKVTPASTRGLLVPSGQEGTPMAQGTDPFDAELEALQRMLDEGEDLSGPGARRQPGERAVAPRGIALRGAGELEDPEAAAYGGQVEPRDLLRSGTGIVNALSGGIESAGRSVLNALDPVELYRREQSALGRRSQESLADNLSEFGADAAPMALYQMLPVVGRGASKALNAAPRIAPPILAGGGVLATSSGTGETQSSPSEETRKLQQEMKDAGFFPHKVDGVGGTLTEQAREKYEASKAAKNQQAIDAARAKAELAKSEGEIEAAKARIKEAEAKAAEDKRKGEERAAGDQRMREMEENVPIARRLLRDYGPNIGYALGIGLGLWGRSSVNKAYNAKSAADATRANALLDGEGDIASRVGKVNQFWAEGQKGARNVEIPFPASPGSRPPFQPNALAPPSGSIYQSGQGRFSDPMTDIGMTAGTAALGALTYTRLKDAQAELSEAQQAATDDPSEVNISRIQSAKDRVAAFQLAFNAELLSGAAFVGSGAKMQRQPSRPDVNLGDAERLRIEQYLNQRTSRNRGPQAPGGSPRPPEPQQSGPEMPATGRYQSRPQTEPGPSAESTIPRSSRKTRPSSPDDLPKGHSYIPAGRGSKVKGPDGKWTEDNITKRSDDTRPMSYRNRLDPED